MQDYRKLELFACISCRYSVLKILINFYILASHRSKNNLVPFHIRRIALQGLSLKLVKRRLKWAESDDVLLG